MALQILPRRRHARTPPTTTTEVATGPPATRLRTARILSWIILPLMIVASIAGLVVRDLYQDPESVSAMLRAYDLVTLVIVVPTMTVALLLRGSPRAQLVWVATLGYAVYTYAIYVFGAAFNDIFLVHAALLSLAVFGFGLALANLDATRIAARFSPRTPVRTVSVVLALLALGLGGMWIYYSLRFAVTGAAPQESQLVQTVAGIHLAYTLDLVLLIPAYGLSAVLLWRRAAWGYVLATVTLVYGAIYQVNYMVALASQANADVPGAVWFDPLEPFIFAIFAVAAALMLGSVRREGGRGADKDHITRVSA